MCAVRPATKASLFALLVSPYILRADECFLDTWIRASRGWRAQKNILHLIGNISRQTPKVVWQFLNNINFICSVSLLLPIFAFPTILPYQLKYTESMYQILVLKSLRFGDFD